MKPINLTSKARGFTLIELVVVIVILGILAATALSKFADMSREARIAAVNQMAGALNLAAQNFRAKCAMSSTCDINQPYYVGGAVNPNAEVTINGVAHRGHYGYPWRDQTGMGGGIGALVQMEGFYDYYYVGGGILNTRMGMMDAPSPVNCSAIYANNLNAPATTTSSYTVVVVTSGC